MDRLFFRALITAFGFRPYDKSPAAFIPYFQYKIGPYVPDFYLYFPKPPAWNRYRWELFEKLDVYHGSDIARYLDFHFSAYPDKPAFLRFLRFEAEGQVKRMGKRRNTYRAKLELVLSWVAEQEGLLRQAIGEPVVGDAPLSPGVESAVYDLVESYSGNIVVNGKHHLERFIQLLILVKDLHTPGKPDNPLFTQFSTVDLAAILRQIKELKKLQVNTLQKKISEANFELRRGDPRKEQQLLAALTEFFYGQAVR